MNKLLFSIPVVALGAAACTHEPVAPAPAPVVVVPAPVVTAPPATVPPGTAVVPQTAPQAVVVPQATVPLRAGMGRVESIMALTGASAGATAADETRRFAVRMEDGSLQYVDARAPNLRTGDRVEITRDGYIRSPV